MSDSEYQSFLGATDVKIDSLLPVEDDIETGEFSAKNQTPIQQEILTHIHNSKASKATALLNQMLHMYLEKSARNFGNLKNAVLTKNGKALRMNARGLKFTTTNIGAVTLAERFKAFEKFGQKKLAQEAIDQLPELESSYMQVIAILETLVSKECKTDAQ